ncbi:hypothetical protein [Bradyrhizobium sp.]|uniref:hypothetical protein n=1 Tax=Bradyrhizobium sp. TaxID=376 RepID=UPI0040382777
MTGFYIVCGFISAVIAAPLYSFMMLWLVGWQRIYVAVLIGAILLASSAQILRTQQLGSLEHLVADLRVPFFIALTLGWLICGFLHAIISLCRGWGPEQAPEPAQD